MLLLTKKAAAQMYMYDENATDYLDEFTNEYSLLKFDIPRDEDVSITDVVDKQIIDKSSYFVNKDNKEYLLFRGYDLRDYKNTPIGYFAFMDRMDYYMDTIVFVRWVSIITTILLMIVVIVLMYKLIRDYADEITEQKNILDYQTHYDSLTGLPNRVLFNDRLQHLIEVAKRKNATFALLFVDLDRFKQINDSLGHVIGDKVLQIISKRLQRIIRKEDTISRLGGDEFTILAQSLKKGEDASVLAQKIILSLSNAIYIDRHTLYVTSSIGISIFPDDGIESDNLLKNADAAMFKAKEEGRNNFQFYSSDMTELAFKRVMMETSLRKALANDEFSVYFQPQVNGKTDKMIGMEALVRWQHPDVGMIFPDKFIPLAQETGLILAIDSWVMKSAMTQVAKWYEMGLDPGILALNLSMKQLDQKGFADKLNLILIESGCKPQWIELEVTEGEIMKNPQSAIEVLGKISQMGIELAVDDFGTGYSSLSYLKHLPIDKLKIDKSFIDGLPNNEEDVSIAIAIIALAKSLKLSVIAEGVETLEQKEFLVENGCDYIQGYYYSKAISVEEMEEMLKNRTKK
ncbi:MAG: diguanylate cyclase [Sulfurimonas sp.]|nr:MAG: diguanylate cyclase [Sulfurimonas sp.]